MGSTVTEAFIRRHVRRILTEEAEKPKAEKPKAEKPKAEKPKAEKPKAEKPKEKKATGQGQLWSGIKGGPLPKWAKEILGGSKKAERLAYTNPGQLMKNLKISGAASGSTTIDRVENLINMARSGQPEMGQAFSAPQRKKDSAGKEGVLVPGAGISGKAASTFMLDTVEGAIKAGVLSLTGNLRIEVIGDSTIIFNVSKRSDRWE